MSIIYEGSKFRIEGAVRQNGEIPAQNFLDGLPRREQAKLWALLKRFGDHGKITNREQFKKIEGTDWFAFKSFSRRLVCYFQRNQRLILTHGFIKKKIEYLMSSWNVRSRSEKNLKIFEKGKISESE